MNIENLTIYSDDQLYRLQLRLQDLYKKHFNNEDLKAQIVELELEMEARGLQIFGIAEGI